MKMAGLAVATGMALASVALGQPRIISLGGSVPMGVKSDGTVAFGSAGSTAAKWDIGASSVTVTPLTGSTNASGCSNDGLFAMGVILNAAGAGGLPTTATLAARWSDGPGWDDLALISPNAGLQVTGPAASSGSISTPRDISATGRFIVGQGYVTSARFRGWVCDTQALGGAGETIVLPTSFNTSLNRYRDGRAIAVSSDGAVILGAEDPSSSSGRPIVYHYNSGTSQYDWSYLPETPDGSGNPITRSIDNFHINAAGTIIVGTSFLWNTSTNQGENHLARWTWNTGSQTWDRELLHNMTSPLSISSWWDSSSCPIPPNYIPTGMSDDGNTIVGILVYSTCSGFVRGGFIWTADDGGTMTDLYDYLNQAGTPGLSDFGPTAFGPVPRLGWANSISADGLHLVGYGGPQSAIGPGWIVDLPGGGCVPPFVTLSPTSANFSRCTSIILNAGAGGSGPLTYQWHKDGSPVFDGTTVSGSVLTGASTSQLRITFQTPSDAGSYTCVVTGACGSPVETAPGVLTVDPAITPAPNDTCVNAATIGEGTNILAPAQSPCGAWVDDVLVAGCVPSSQSDLWFRWVPTFTGEARIETCGASYDTVLSAFSDCSGGELACNNDVDQGPSTGCSSSRSRIARMPVTAGVPVLIKAAARAALSGTPTLNISINPAPPVAAGDTCANVPAAVVGANPFDTTEATNDFAATCNNATSRDVWRVYTATTTGWLKASTCPGTTWNTVLSIASSCQGTELACNDNASITGCSNQSIIDNFRVTAGTDYYLRIGGSSATNFGAGTLTLSFFCPADFNRSGAVSSQDIFDFLAAFFTPGSLAADFNNSGAVSSQDIFDFLAAFFTTCP